MMFIAARNTRSSYKIEGSNADEFSSLKVAIDYATPTAALSPFTIDRIDRTVERRPRYNAVLWTLPINWPTGEITFEAAGFLLELRAAPASSCSMSLPREPAGGR